MTGLVRLLVRLFPPAFRRRFGPELKEQALEDLRRARKRGRLAGLGEGMATTADLVRAAMTERVAPSWTGGASDHDDGRMGTMMTEWTGDLRHAARSLARVPGFTATAVGTLGLAIGVNAGLFSVVDSVLLQPLPFHDAEELVFVAASAPGSDYPPEFGVSSEFFHQYREAEGLDEVAVWDDFTNTARLDDRVERIIMVAAAHTLFETLGVEPLLGRLPSQDDAAPVVVLSHAMWTSWFGRDPTVVGRTVFAAGEDRTIIGVMGPDFWFPYEGVQLWIPSPMRVGDYPAPRFGSGMVARRAPGAEPGALTAELDRLADRIPERFGWSAADARIMERHRPVVRALEEELLGDISGPLWILLGSVGIVLLIACANVANLFLVRAEHRGRDMAVRAALGAGRRRRMRVLLSEAVVVAGGAGVLAMALAWAGVPLLVQAAPDGLPRLDEVRLTPLSLVFTGGLSFFAAVACGLLPALRGSRGDLTRLRDGSRGSTGRGGTVRRVLVAGQTALALVLLIASGHLARSFLALSRVDPGYDTRNLLTFQIAPEGDALTDGPSFARFHLDFSRRLAALPGVESTGIVENVPLEEGLSSERFLPAASVADPETAPLLAFTFADGRYFETMGIDLVAGRAFTPDEATRGPPTAVVSESAARLLWPTGDPVGEQLRAAQGQTSYTVIGVVEDILQYDLRQEPDPMIYLPLVGPTATSWVLSSPGHVVRSTRAAELVPEVRALVREMAPRAPLYRVHTMESLAGDSMEALTFTLLTLGITSVLALMLGMVGLFGVLSYAVAQRTREIGVRMALGADAGDVRAMVVRQGAGVVAAGVALGLAVSWLSTRALTGLLYGVEPGDPATFLAMAAAMVAVGLLASWLPASRASRVPPAESLRGA